jgi:peptidoglycan-associated lipoprotein
MKRRSFALGISGIILMSLLVLATAGCSKKSPAKVPAPESKTEVAAPPSPPAVAPTINLRVSPAAIEKGQTSILTWSSTDATGVTIDNGIGSVEASGSREVSPPASATYMARATGPGGTAVAEARLTVSAPSAVTPAPPPSVSDSEYFATAIKDAFFDYDQYSIREDARAVLTADARALNQRPHLRITIEGHCDERGSEKYNLALGDKRAIAVKDFLVSQGVSAGRIDTISFGEEQNFCQDHTEECWQLNRRAHIVMR